MVVYGFLSYKEGYVVIRNKELLDKFADMVCQKPAFGYIYQLAAESQRMSDGDIDIYMPLKTTAFVVN